MNLKKIFRCILQKGKCIELIFRYDCNLIMLTSFLEALVDQHMMKLREFNVITAQP